MAGCVSMPLRGRKVCLVSLSVALLLCILVVASGQRTHITVAQDGSGDYKTITAAIYNVKPAYLPEDGTTLFIKQGFYNETVVILPYMRYMTVIGDTAGVGTTVSCNRYSGMLNANGDVLSTLNSACFVVFADDFTAVHMHFLNASPRPPPSSFIFQAVALRVTANRTLFYKCTMRSFQDTLYAHTGWQYYRDCFIFGTVDFIFGQAKALFDNCTMMMSSYGFASVTAQERLKPYDDNCYVFSNSKVVGDPVPWNGQGYLGRAWGQYACTIFANSYLDQVVAPEGWNNFFMRSRNFTSFYAEFNNTGIGANLQGRVDWTRMLTPYEQSVYLSYDWLSLCSWYFPSELARLFNALGCGQLQLM